MGTLSSGVGLISGLDYKALVDQLIAVESGPRNKLLERVGEIDAQRTAYLNIAARITALLSRIEVLKRPTSFQAATATSSAADVLSATAGSGAQPGSYTFVVRGLAATHQLVSRGFANSSAPLAPGTLTIESAAARVNSATRLEELNGQAGVRRGSFEIINKAGQKATINIIDSLTVGEVIEKINAAGISVSASIRGDSLVLTDNSGGAGTLRVQDVGGGQAAADLGFGSGHGQSAGIELVGRRVIYLSTNSLVKALNDGVGIRAARAGGDFSIEADGKLITVDLSDTLTHSTRLQRLNHGQGVRLGQVKITSRDGSSTVVDLSGAQNINDVKQTLEAAFGGGRIIVVLSGSRLIISDKTDISKLEPGQKRDFAIEDVSGYAALDLGIAGSSSDGKISGRNVLHMETIGDIISAINYAPENVAPDKQPIVSAAVTPEGYGLQLSTRWGKMVIKAGSNSSALFDLGLQEGTYYDLGGGAVASGTRIIGGLDTVLLKTLNGGAGFAGSTLRIEANGGVVTLDVSAVRTLRELIELINAASVGGQPLGVEAGYDATGTKLVIRNTQGASVIRISGDFAESLGLAQTASTITSNNLQRRYISETTRLADLNAGRGIARGKFKITAANGAFGIVDLSGSGITTVRDVITAINDLNIGVTASINSTGDGLLLSDTTGGAGTLRVEEEGGTTARDLNLLRSAVDGKIDGSYEFRLAVGGSETLESLAARIGKETTLASASVLNDGTAFAPYRLSIVALVSGARGELLIDDGGTGLGITTLGAPRDARVLLSGDNQSGMLLTSSTNTFENIVGRLTLNANAVSDKPVTVKVDRDLKTLISTMKGLVDDFNAAMDQIREAGKFDAETQVAAVLQGEGTLRTVESRLYRMFTGTIRVGARFQRLSDLGIRADSNNHLRFDEDKFRQAFAADPQAVLSFFADENNGVAADLKKQVEDIAGSGGIIEKRTTTLADRKEMLQERVGALNERLERKRTRLLRQFQALETVLSQMQSQQATLSNLANWAQSGLRYNSSAYR